MLMCTLLLRVNSFLSEGDQSSFQLSTETLSFSLLISNLSVIGVGILLIFRSCFNTSEGDFLDTGFQFEEGFRLSTSSPGDRPDFRSVSSSSGGGGRGVEVEMSFLKDDGVEEKEGK